MLSRPLRLTIVYGFIWTCLLTGLLFLSKTLLETVERANARDRLAVDWSAMKGYLRIERGQALWYADSDDPDETAFLAHLKRVVMVTEAQGKVLEVSPTADDLRRTQPGIFAAAFQEVKETRAPVVTSAKDRSGKTILLMCGELRDERGSQRYYGLIGTPLIGERLFNRWPFLIPLAAMLSFALSWLMVRQARKIELPAVGIVS